jgi:hypothetical protein
MPMIVKEFSKSPREEVYASLLKQNKIFLINLAGSIKRHFPTLEDGSKGIELGETLSALDTVVLRPKGNLALVDLEHSSTVKKEERVAPDENYFSMEILIDAQRKIDEIKQDLSNKHKPNIIFKIGHIFDRRRLNLSQPKNL